MSSPLSGGDPGSTPPAPPAALPAYPPPLPAASPYARTPKNPWIALLLSFLFPGVGQVYNGQIAKALALFAAFVGAIYGTAEINPFPFGFAIPFVYLFNLVDAYRSATLINDRALRRALPEEEEVAESPAWGATLVAIGLLLLFHNLGWLRAAAFQRWWPLLLIVAGALFLRGALRRRQGAE
jgi:TM2 domain-containing membrane protein YozV